MAFLERDIKTRKQAFGIIAYDIIKSSSQETNNLSVQLQKAFDEARGDIQALEAKLILKKNEMEALDNHHHHGSNSGGDGVGEDAEAPGIPSS